MALQKVFKRSLYWLKADNLAKCCTLTQQQANMSSFPHVSVSTNEESGVATVAMQRKPVNSLNIELITALSSALEKLHNDEQCKGVILTSHVPGIFSAGLDILEMYQQPKENLEQFWYGLQGLWLSLYGSRLVTMAAVTGHAPAGGCMLALSCDYRLMVTGDYTIGLNETKLGIVAPFWFADMAERTIGARQAELALQLGKLFTTEQALAVGLVDKLCAPDEISAAAEHEMASWLRIPEGARYSTKTSLRQHAIAKLSENRQQDVDHFVKFVTQDSVQKIMGAYLEKLRAKK